MGQQMTGREGRLIAVVTLASFFVASAVASGVAALASEAGVPWWIVTPVAWIIVYYTMRALLRSFFTRHLGAA